MQRRKYLKTAGVLAAVSAFAGCVSEPENMDNKVESLPVPTLGDADAPVTMMVFEDYRCSHCKDFNENTAPKIIEEYVDSGKVLYEHRDFPILGQGSVQAANAARSVQYNDDIDSFWQFSKLLFDNQNAIGFDLYEEAAEQVGVDGNTVKSEAMSGRYNPVIDADASLARNSGATGTPTVVVNGEKVNARQDFTQSIALSIEEAL